MATLIVNHLGELRPGQTTTRFIEAYLEAGEKVAVTDIFSLAAARAGDLRAHAVVLERSTIDEPSRAQICRSVNTRKPKRIDLAEHGPIVIRTSPGRDIDNAWAHRLALEVCHLASDHALRVVNDPVALAQASSKLYNVRLPPEVTPATLVTHSYDDVRAYLKTLGKPAVLKPLLGSQGRDVFFVDGPEQANLRQVCELMGRSGYLVVQEYLDGDIRVLILDGRILSVEGRDCAVRRVPKANEFRSNVALGARAMPAQLEPSQRAVAAKAAAVVFADGIRFAGLDVVGDKVVEVNVYSTGGLVDAEAFYERNYARVVLTALAEDPAASP
jgi:glutathione synthase